MPKSFVTIRLGKKYVTLLILVALAVSILFSGAQGNGASPTFRLPRPAAQPTPAIATPHQMLAPPEARIAADNAIDALQNGNVEEATTQLNKALEVFPHYAVALTIRGIIAINNKEFEMGAADLEEAVRSDPAYVAPRVALASCYNDLERYDDALALLARGSRLLPYAWQSHFEMARSLYGKADYEAALQEATEATQLAPSDLKPRNRALIHYLRAHVLAQVKEFSAAKEEFAQTLKADPDGDLSVSSRKALDLFQSAGR